MDPFSQFSTVMYMVNNHIDNEETCCNHSVGYSFLIDSKGSFIHTVLIDRIIHTMAFGISVVEHWLECEKSQLGLK